ncbi:MAG: VTT domain-containing protein [bacterium]|nr:VTT domain-containing protein [bacterium]
METFFSIDLPSFIKAAGYAGLFAVVFAESGLLIGLFFPGDSLLFTAGFLASQGFFHIALLAGLTFIAAVVGDSVGYTFGRRLGPRIFQRENSLLFNKEHLERAKRFYEAHGGKTIILARFMPVVRTFAPILAGVGKMHYPTFLFYNVVGGVLWAVGLTSLGYALGSLIPGIDQYLIPIVLAIIIISVLPSVVAVLKDRSRRAQARLFLKQKVFRRL